MEPMMRRQRILGIVSLILGVLVITGGINPSLPLFTQVSQAFSARITAPTCYFVSGGLICIIGLFMVLLGGHRKTAPEPVKATI
jgi:hypothetical protein